MGWGCMGCGKCQKPLPRRSTNAYLVATNLSHCISARLTWRLLFHWLRGHSAVIFLTCQFLTQSFSARRICTCNSTRLFLTCHFFDVCISNTLGFYVSLFNTWVLDAWMCVTHLDVWRDVWFVADGTRCAWPGRLVIGIPRGDIAILNSRGKYFPR